MFGRKSNCIVLFLKISLGKFEGGNSLNYLGNGFKEIEIPTTRTIIYLA